MAASPSSRRRYPLPEECLWWVWRGITAPRSRAPPGSAPPPPAWDPHPQAPRATVRPTGTRGRGGGAAPRRAAPPPRGHALLPLAAGGPWAPVGRPRRNLARALADFDS